MDHRIRKYAERVGYTNADMEKFRQGGHRIRQVNRLSEAAPLYSIEAEVVESRNCNSGHANGQKMILDIDGNLIAKFCPALRLMQEHGLAALPVCEGVLPGL